MSDIDNLAEQFEEHRAHLRSVAYRMLGSLSEAEDAVQEAWIRLSRSDVGEVRNLAAWLTTVVSRLSLDMLRSRETRREDAIDDTHVPDPIVTLDPEQEVVMADSVGLALLVVLETLAPAERVAFVLHDMFAVPFDDIAVVLERTPAATRQLASRARRRVQGSPTPDADLNRQREVVEAFIAASRGGDFEALVALLDPEVMLRVDAGKSSVSTLLRGAEAVAGRAFMYRKLSQYSRVVLINGEPGMLNAPDGEPSGLMSFTIVNGRVVELNILADPARLAALPLT
ncbi:MAG: sigma-70 family RNA polymerase sigma factor [Nonomuraea sp.]|nr:sigma-70 family RNA polymerase sigma factor [Nonomuraea sp.]